MKLNGSSVKVDTNLAAYVHAQEMKSFLPHSSYLVGIILFFTLDCHIYIYIYCMSNLCMILVVVEGKSECLCGYSFKSDRHLSICLEMLCIIHRGLSYFLCFHSGV